MKVRWVIVLLFLTIFIAGCRYQPKPTMCSVDSDCPSGYDSDCPSGCIHSSYGTVKCLGGICCMSGADFNLSEPSGEYFFMNTCAMNIGWYGDIKYCEKSFADTKYMDTCVDEAITKIHLFHNLNECKKLPETLQKDKCFLSAAIDKLNATLCSNVVDSNQSDYCLAYIYQKHAISKKDFSYCDMMPKDVEKYNWKKEISFSYCYFEVIKAAQEYNKCDGIINTTIRDRCYSMISYYNPDPSICDNIININVSLNCKSDVFQHLAGINKDPSYCEQVPIDASTTGLSSKAECYMEMAKILNNATYCIKMATAIEKALSDTKSDLKYWALSGKYQRANETCLTRIKQWNK